MKRLLKAAAALVCAFGFTFAHAQMTTITASSINMGGVPIAAGTVTFTPVNLSGIAIPFATGGGGLNAPTAFSCTITTGAITGSCSVPDAALTTPANILYSVQITNTGTQKSFTLQQVPNITGTTWALDHYGPPSPTTNVQAVQVAYGTAAPPASCVSPSFYVRNYSGGQLFVCVGGTFVQITGGGGSSYTFSNGLSNSGGTVTPAYGATANTVAQGNDARFAANAAAASAAQTTANAAAVKSNNLSDLANISTALANLGFSSGSSIPRGVAAPSPAVKYVQTFANGSTQTWKPSATLLNWVNETTGQVVYAGNSSMILTSAIDCYDVPPGQTGVVPDTCGSNPLTLNGTLTRNGTTGGVVFPGSGTAYLSGLPNSALSNGYTYMMAIVGNRTNADNVLIGNTLFDTLGLDSSGRPYIFNVTNADIGITNASTTWQLPGASVVTFEPNASAANQIFSGYAPVPAMSHNISQPFAGGTVVGIGSYSNYANYPFSGTMYCLYVFNTTLSQEVVQHNADVISVQLASRSVTVSSPWVGYGTNNSFLYAALGDSITAGHLAAASAPQGYVSYFAADAGSSPNVMDFGIGGQMAAHVADYELPAAVTASTYFSATQKFATELIGTNDLGTLTLATYLSQVAGHHQALHNAGYKVIMMTIPPKAQCTGTCESGSNGRLAANAGLIAARDYEGYIDLGNDLRLQNPQFSPYLFDGIHPNDAMYQIIAKKLLTETNRLGITNKGNNAPCVAYSATPDFDLSLGTHQCIVLTGNVTYFTVSNFNQGTQFSIDFIQAAPGGYTVGIGVVGSGATATAPLTGSVPTFTVGSGGTNYKAAWLPAIVATGGTCTSYPKFIAVLSAGAVTAGNATGSTPGNCSVAPTLTFVSTEPVWHSPSALVTTTAGTTTTLNGAYDSTGANVTATLSAAQ